MNGPHPPTAESTDAHEMTDGQRLALSLALASVDRDLTDEESELVSAYDYGARSTPWPQPTRDQARAEHVVARAVRSSYSHLMVLRENYPERWANLGPGWVHELDLPTQLTPWELHVVRSAAAHELRLLRADRRTQRKRLFKRWKVRRLLALLGTVYDAREAFADESRGESTVTQGAVGPHELLRSQQAVTGSGPPPPRRVRRLHTKSRRGGHGGSPSSSLPPRGTLRLLVSGVAQTLP